MSEQLGKFGHHPDPAIDFCVEVEELMSIATDRKLGFPNPDDDSLARRVECAMNFIAGGDPSAVDAKAEVRAINKALAAGAVPSRVEQ